MKADEFGRLISELRLTQDKYKYLDSINGTYDTINFCYIVYFNCDFCGDFITIPVSIVFDYKFDANTIKNVESAFIYEKYFT